MLNATFEPLCIVATRRALVLVLDGKADLVHDTGAFFHSARAAYPEPSVVRLAQYVRLPRQTRVAISRHSVFARDNHRCQYCGAAAENIDHVVPRSRGGAHTWDNVVAACRRCNAAKEDRLLEDTGFVLARVPTAPRSRVWLLVTSGELRSDWKPYVAPVLERAAGL